MLLALETSGKSASVALARSDGTIDCVETDPQFGSARTMAAAIKALILGSGAGFSELKAIAVTVGPGSFTGLRVGVATAKTMAYGLGIPTVSVDALSALMRQDAEWDEFDELWGVMDAYRGELFVAGGKKSSENQQIFQIVWPSKILDGGVWTHQMKRHLDDRAIMGQRTAFVGPGLHRLREFSHECARRPEVALYPDRKPTAREVAQIGLEKLARGEITDPFHLMPVYFRASAAEEKLRTSPAS